MKSNKNAYAFLLPFCNGLISRFLSIFSILLFCLIAALPVSAQGDNSNWWHGIKREIHYKPSGEDFVLANGKHRFNRALYGTNTAFRVEAGDLPEFALYMPGMGGNFKFGLISKDQSKWLINAKNIKTIYRPGCMIYEVRDSWLANGFLQITILALADAEGMIVKTRFSNVPANIQLLWAFGGATGKKFSRDGDIGADPESSFYLQPDYCKNNLYTIKRNSFNLSYGSGKVLSEEDRYGNKPAGNDAKKPSTEETNSQKDLIGVVPPSSSLFVADATKQNSPAELYQSKGSSTPVVAGVLNSSANKDFYFFITNPDARQEVAYNKLKDVFASFAGTGFSKTFWSRG